MGKEVTVIKVNLVLKKNLKDNIKAILKLNPVLVLRYTRQISTLCYNNYISVNLLLNLKQYIWNKKKQSVLLYSPLKKLYVQC